MRSSACMSSRGSSPPPRSPAPAARPPDNRGLRLVIIARSLVFNTLFYLVLLAYFVVAIPTMLLPYWGILGLARHWGRTNLVLLRIVCGTRVEWRGLERIPRGPVLIAAKHQSLWETFALL